MQLVATLVQATRTIVALPSSTPSLEMAYGSGSTLLPSTPRLSVKQALRKARARVSWL